MAGRRSSPTLIDRVQDRYGKTIYRHDKRECNQCCNQEWHEQPEPELFDIRPEVMNPYTAYQITSMMEGVVERGTGKKLKLIGKPVAGKTGTSNDERDAWFIGFTPDLTVGVYIGYDNPKPMGKGRTGGELAAPSSPTSCAWRCATSRLPRSGCRKGIELIPINVKSGQRDLFGDAGVILEAFKPGEEPPSRTKSLAMRWRPRAHRCRREPRRRPRARPYRRWVDDRHRRPLLSRSH